MVWVAKILGKDRPSFMEVLKVSDVAFDPRPGWVLLAFPIGAPPHKQVDQWFHPSLIRFEWVREFRFGDKP